MSFFYEPFSNLPRQGPGSTKSTQRAIEMVRNLPKEPEILDIGCGSGIQTLELLKIPQSRVTALDSHQPFLDRLKKKAEQEGFGERLTTVKGDMRKPDFDLQFDLVWSEGSIYIVGLETGLKLFRPFIKSGGSIALSHIAWIKENPPAECIDFWNQDFPDIATDEKNQEIIKKSGFKLTGSFPLPPEDWLVDYYNPLQKNVDRLRIKYSSDKEKQQSLNEIQHEIDVFHKYHEYYSYVFYVAEKE